MRFSGTETYVATPDLTAAVNAAVVLERPLLVKGEPGTGKTVLAEEIAKGLNAPLLVWNIKSTTKAQQGLYEYDAVSRLRDSQLGDPRVRREHIAGAAEEMLGYSPPWAVRRLTALGEQHGALMAITGR